MTQISQEMVIGLLAALLAKTDQTYVDALFAGLPSKAPARAATTASITLSGTQTVDGVSLVAGDRVLVKNQTTQSQNGIYVVATGAWTRSTDLDTWAEAVGAFVYVNSGTTQAATSWNANVMSGGTIGTTAMPWVQYAGSGTYSAGSGLVLSGTQFALSPTVPVTTLNLLPSADLTMAANAITVTGSYHRVSTSTGSPEDLITINGGTVVGQLLTLASNSGAATLRSTGNIGLFGGDMVLFGNAAISFRWNGTAWMEVSRTRRAGGISRLTVDQATTIVTGVTPEFVYLEGARTAARTYNLSVSSFSPGDAIEFYNATTGGFSMTIRNNATAATIGTIAPGKAFRAKYVDSTIGFVPFFTSV